MLMKRRNFLKTAGVSLASMIIIGAVGGASGKGDRNRPNFLFILADDVTYSDLGCYGGKNAKTPNIDRFATEGIRFKRAYCAMSMCAPFRAELYTGLYPVRNGVAWNHSAAKPKTTSVCHYLRDLNYRVGLVGKKHASPADVFNFENVKGQLAGTGAADFISRDKKQPFCLFACSHNAHPPWRSGDESKIDRDGMTLPPVIHDNPVTRKTFAAYIAEVETLDREVGDILSMLKESGQQDNTMVIFCSEQGWDFAFGKWTNWDIGVRTALIARWPGHIKPGRVTDALVQITDIVPTFIAAGGGNPADYDLDGVSFLDVLKGRSDKHRQYVYCLHNNVPEGNPYPIRSIRDDRFHYIVNLNHKQPYHEKHLMSENLAKRYDLQWWGALKDAAENGDASAKKLYEKYHNRPAEELYLVDEDPWETQNLADKTEYAKAKKRLSNELHKWMARQNDPGAAMDTIEIYSKNRKQKAKKKK